MTFRSRTVALAAFLMLPLAVQAVWIWWPSVQSVYLAFTTWDGIGTPQFVGLRNFKLMATDPIFLTALLNNVKWAVLYTVVPLALGLALAVLIDRPLHGKNVYKTAIFLPGVLSLVAAALMWSWLLQPEGLVNMVTGALGMHSRTAWLGDPNTVTWSIIGVAIWQTTGFVMVLYLAGLQAVPPELESAARTDGASEWQVFRRVTFPLLRPIHAVVFAGSVIAAFKTFDMVWVLTQGGPYHSSDTLATYMYEKAFIGYRFGYGSALAVVILLVSLVFIVVYMYNVLAEDKIV